MLLIFIRVRIIQIATINNALSIRFKILDDLDFKEFQNKYFVFLFCNLIYLLKMEFNNEKVDCNCFYSDNY